MKIKSLFILIVLMLIFVSFTSRQTKILMAGDSTMADKVFFKTVTDSVDGQVFEEPFLERGWGQLLPEFVNEKVIVKNYAKNGRSTRTFIEEGLWTELINSTSKGDFVIIQFGHNDAAVAKKSYTNSEQFRLNFIAFVNDVRAKGANPIVCTPVARRKFNENGILELTHGEYPDLIRSLAKAQKVPLIDLEKLTTDWLQNEGVVLSKKYFHNYPPGVSKVYPKGLEDNTHFNEAGARHVALLFVQGVKKLEIKGIKKLINQ
ncbi:MAG: rhamnogalacturonan acetylesterase [Paludibacteraceae bacterium]